MSSKFFTLEEARKLLPEVREMILAANKDLENLADDLLDANEKCDRLERRLNSTHYSSSKPEPATRLAEDESRPPEALFHPLQTDENQTVEEAYTRSAESLALLQSNYVKRLSYWIEKITESGIILRDLRTGLIDFPARKESMVYFLCWRLDEPDIAYWHLPRDGLIGRKPLAVLIEY